MTRATGTSGGAGSTAAKRVRSDALSMTDATTEAGLALQQEILDAYEQMSRAWLDRVKSEADMWSDLSRRLASARTVTDAMSTYQQLASQRMQMAANDGRRLFNDSQRLMNAITRSLSAGRGK